jgi:hypothetical protein
MTGALKFLRRRLPEDKFLSVLTSQYYGTCYYACQAWLGAHTRKMDIRKLNGMHYKLLRIAKNDWKNKISRSTLDNLGRARPTIWAKYATANMTIKVLRDERPKRIHNHLRNTLYYERRSKNVMKFYDISRKRIGKQAIGNRLKSVFDEITEPITFNESDNSLRVLLKRTFFIKPDSSNVLPIGVCFNGPGGETKDDGPLGNDNHTMTDPDEGRANKLMKLDD